MIISCSANRGLSSNEEKTIKNCINNILNNEGKDIKNCYLVNPYFDSFSLDNYSKENEEILFEKFEWEKEDFLKLQNTINDKYENNYSKDLSEYSKCDESQIILSFSGVYKNLIFVRLIDNYKKVNLENIENDYEFDPNQIYYYAFILDNNTGEINEVLMDSIHYD